MIRLSLGCPVQNLNKNKEVLSSVEERLRATSLELQRTQMDLMAKKGECNVSDICEMHTCRHGSAARNSVCLEMGVTLVMNNGGVPLRSQWEA
jgi:hypothetical protein